MVFFVTGSLDGLELAKEVRLARSEAPRSPVSASSLLKLKCIPHLAFDLDSGAEFRS